MAHVCSLETSALNGVYISRLPPSFGKDALKRSQLNRPKHLLPKVLAKDFLRQLTSCLTDDVSRLSTN